MGVALSSGSWFISIAIPFGLSSVVGIGSGMGCSSWTCSPSVGVVGFRPVGNGIGE